MRRTILAEAISQINISNKFDTAILAIPSYLRLCNRINELLLLGSKTLKTHDSGTSLAAINKLFEFSSLQFFIKGFEEFVTLKESNSVRKYADSFRKHLSELPNGNLDEFFLIEAMMEAINKDEIANKISGAFSIASTVTGIASMIPFLGMVTSPASIAADASSRSAKGFSEKFKWWLLGTEISKTLTKKRIESIYKLKHRK